MLLREGDKIARGQYPIFWLYAAGIILVLWSSFAATSTTGRMALTLIAVSIAVVMTPARYAVGIAVLAAIFAYVLVPVIAVQGLALALPAAVLALAFIALLKRWHSLRVPKQLFTVVALFGLLVFSTAMFSRDSSPLWVAVLLMLAAVPTFFLAGNMSDAELRVVSVSIFLLLGVQMVLAMAEATGLIEAIYEIAVDVGHGPKVLQKNTIIADWSRATGTMLHGLPLGFLAVTAAGLSTISTPTYRWSRKVRMLVFIIAAAACLFASARSSLVVLAVLAVSSFPAGKTLSKVLQATIVAILVGLLLIGNGFFESRQVVDLVSSGSVVHRLGVVSMLPLLDREPVLNFLIGNGTDAGNLLEHLLPNDGWLAVDNQLISTLLMTGIIGLIMLGAVLCSAWKNTPEWRFVFVAQVAMFAIFDVMLWQSSLVLLMLVLGAMLAKRGPQFREHVVHPLETPAVLGDVEGVGATGYSQRSVVNT